MFAGTRNYYKIKVESQYNCYRNQNMEQLLGVSGVQVASGTEMASTGFETLDNCELNGKTKCTYYFSPYNDLCQILA